MNSSITTKKISETSWSGSRIDFELSANLTSIVTNCTNILKNIENLQSDQGKRATADPLPIETYDLNDYEKQLYGENAKKHVINYKVWKIDLGNTNYASYLGKIKEEIGMLQDYIKENSVQFAGLERSAEEIAQEYNKILYAARAAGIDIGAILLHNTDAPTKSGESGDRTLKGEYSHIKEENFYLYEKLEDGEYLDLEEGTGVEAGTYFIVKHTKDGRKVRMKNIDADISKDWINEVYKAKKDKDKKTRDNIIKGLAPAGASIIGLGNKVKGALENKVKGMQAAQSAKDKAQADGKKRTNQINDAQKDKNMPEHVSNVHSTKSGQKVGGGGGSLGEDSNSTQTKGTSGTSTKPQDLQIKQDDAYEPPSPKSSSTSTGATVVESGTSSTGIAVQDGTGRKKDVISVTNDPQNKTTTYTLSDESSVTFDKNNNVVTPKNAQTSQVTTSAQTKGASGTSTKPQDLQIKQDDAYAPSAPTTSGFSGGTWDKDGNYNSNDGNITIYGNNPSNQSQSKKNTIQNALNTMADQDKMFEKTLNRNDNITQNDDLAEQVANNFNTFVK